MAKSILIIDDEDLITKSLLKLLKAAGYAVSVAASGKEALDLIRASEYDLIVSDVRMPEMDGIETIKYIRETREKTGKKPVPEILITGYADADKYEQANELHIFDYLYKPFDNEDFLRVVRKAIG